MRRFLVSLSVNGCGFLVLFAAQLTDARADEPGEGMVLGQTVTVAGQDFFQRFVSGWREKGLSERYQIMVRERPSARTGSIIWIEHRGQRLMQFALPTSRGLIHGVSEQAVEAVWQRLTEEEINAHLGSDPDLARDEL